VDRLVDYLEAAPILAQLDSLDQAQIPSNRRRICLGVRTSLVRNLQGRVFLAQPPQIHFLEADSSNSSSSSHNNNRLSRHLYLGLQPQIHFLGPQTGLISVNLPQD
jgi:hypothetical protein